MTRRETTTRRAPKTATAPGKQYSGLPGLDWRTVTPRVAGVGLLIAAGAIHLDLYLTGYRTIPTIGWLFLLQVIAGFAFGLAVLAAGGLPVLAASPHPELRIFTPEEGGAEHIGLDHLPYVSTYVADWVSDVFRSLPAAAPSTTERRQEEPT